MIPDDPDPWRAHPWQPGKAPTEVAYVATMEWFEYIPRQEKLGFGPHELRNHGLYKMGHCELEGDHPIQCADRRDWPKFEDDAREQMAEFAVKWPFLRFYPYNPYHTKEMWKDDPYGATTPHWYEDRTSGNKYPYMTEEPQ